MVMCTRLGLCIASRGVVYDTGRCGGWAIITKGDRGRGGGKGVERKVRLLNLGCGLHLALVGAVGSGE